MRPFLSENDLIELLVSHNLYTSLVKKALEQAKKSHSEHKRDTGTPYLEEHIYPIVKDLVEANYVDEKIVVSALLHDVLEDDPNMTHEAFVSLFGESIYEIVRALTKPIMKTTTQEDKYNRNSIFLEQIKKGPKEAHIIKLADHLNNLLCSPNFSEPKYKRYIKESEDFYLPFAKETNEYYYKKLKKLCDDRLNE